MDAAEPAEVDLPLLALLQRASRMLADEFLESLSAAGVESITPAHMVVLAHLDDDTALSIAELARRADVSRQTMHRAVGQLVEEGLLTSRPGRGFPRSTLIELSAAGHQRRAIALGLMGDLEAGLEARVGRDELARLRGTLERVVSD